MKSFELAPHEMTLSKLTKAGMPPWPLGGPAGFLPGVTCADFLGAPAPWPAFAFAVDSGWVFEVVGCVDSVDVFAVAGFVDVFCVAAVFCSLA